MEIINTGLTNKLSGLLFFLKRSRTEFEMVADEIEDNSLRTALNGLSNESSYYAGELKNYIKSLGIGVCVNDSFDLNEISDYPVAEETGKGDELLTICTHNESSLTQAYNELLNESLPFQSLKDLMMYQLNALKFTFMKIKTLNTARFMAY